MDFLAATVEHIPPKNQQTVRYYGLYSNKSRGMAAKTGRRRPEMADMKRPERVATNPAVTLFILPPPEPRSGRYLRPLWRDLIMKVWSEDPHKFPRCPGTMKVAGTMIRRSEVDFFLRLHGLWEWGEADIDCRMAARRVERKRHQPIVALPPPPDPPFDIDTMELIEVPPHAIWRDDFEEFGPDRGTEADTAWEAPELELGNGRRLVLKAPDPFPEEERAGAGVN